MGKDSSKGSGSSSNSRERRDRARIYAELLEFIYHIILSEKKFPRVTRIQLKINVPFIRFKEYLDDLQKKGLIEKVNSEIRITKKGIQYVEDYKRVREFLQKFGMLSLQEDED